MRIRVKHRETEIEIIKDGFYQSDYSSTKKCDSEEIVIPELKQIVESIKSLQEKENI